VQENVTITGIVLLSVGEAIQDACFSLAHWMFAWRYYRIGVDMPFIIDGKELPDPS
jgi:hypothetical protein